jgi:hypothetical protein
MLQIKIFEADAVGQDFNGWPDVSTDEKNTFFNDGCVSDGCALVGGIVGFVWIPVLWVRGSVCAEERDKRDWTGVWGAWGQVLFYRVGISVGDCVYWHVT